LPEKRRSAWIKQLGHAAAAQVLLLCSLHIAAGKTNELIFS
jgi:hypothetical protein